MDRSVVMGQIAKLGGAFARSFGLEDRVTPISTETLHKVYGLAKALPGINTAEVADALLFYALHVSPDEEFARLIQYCGQYCDEAGMLAVVQFTEGPGMSESLVHCDLVEALWLLQALGKMGCRPASREAFMYCYRQLSMLGEMQFDNSLDQVVASNIEPFMRAAAGEDPFPPAPPARQLRGRERLFSFLCPRRRR